MGKNRKPDPMTVHAVPVTIPTCLPWPGFHPPSAMGGSKVSRKQIGRGKACARCRKKQARCDGKRPCFKCISQCCPDECTDQELEPGKSESPKDRDEDGMSDDNYVGSFEGSRSFPFAASQSPSGTSSKSETNDIEIHDMQNLLRKSICTLEQYIMFGTVSPSSRAVQRTPWPGAIRTPSDRQPLQEVAPLALLAKVIEGKQLSPAEQLRAFALYKIAQNLSEMSRHGTASLTTKVGEVLVMEEIRTSANGIPWSWRLNGDDGPSLLGQMKTAIATPVLQPTPPISFAAASTQR